MRSEVTSTYRSMIDRLSALRAFMAVVEAGSFSEAALRLNVMPSTVSKHVSLLEERFKGQLIIRSTKNLSVTELGHHFYERCMAVIREVEEMESDLLQYQMHPQGKLVVTAGPSFGYHFLPVLLPDFLKKNPSITVKLTISPESLDLIDNSIDVAIRISQHLHPGLVAVKLAPNVRTICAAPSYLEQHGRPEKPSDLAHHNCLLTSDTASGMKWLVGSDDGDKEIQVSSNLIVNNALIYREAVIQGAGIGYLSRYLVYDAIAEGKVIELFPQQRMVNSYIYLAYAQRRNLPLKTRAFIDFMREAFRDRSDLAKEVII
jgi:DNA-binding transcriptional LysR family regulator